MSEYGLSFEIASPDGTRRYSGLMFKGVETEGHVALNQGVPPFPAGTAMVIATQNKLITYGGQGYPLGATYNGSQWIAPDGLPLWRMPTWSQVGSANNAGTLFVSDSVLIPNVDCTITGATTIFGNANGFLTYYGVAVGMSVVAKTGVPAGNTVTAVTDTQVTVSPGGMTVNATPTGFRFGFTNGDFTVPGCVVSSTSQVTCSTGNRDFAATGVKIGMLVRGTGVPTGSIITAVTQSTITVGAAGLTPTAGPLVMTITPSPPAPVPDFVRYPSLMPVHPVENGSLGFVGVALEDPVVGRSVRLGSHGTICSVFCIPSPAANVTGVYAVASASSGKVTGSATAALPIGSGLGLILTTAGTDQTTGSSGVADQFGVLVAPR